MSITCYLADQNVCYIDRCEIGILEHNYGMVVIKHAQKFLTFF